MTTEIPERTFLLKTGDVVKITFDPTNRSEDCYSLDEVVMAGYTNDSLRWPYFHQYEITTEGLEWFESGLPKTVVLTIGERNNPPRKFKLEEITFSKTPGSQRFMLNLAYYLYLESSEVQEEIMGGPLEPGFYTVLFNTGLEQLEDQDIVVIHSHDILN